MSLGKIAVLAASASLWSLSAMADPVTLTADEMDTVTAGVLTLPAHDGAMQVFAGNKPPGEANGAGLLPLWEIFGGITDHATNGSVGEGNPIIH